MNLNDSNTAVEQCEQSCHIEFAIALKYLLLIPTTQSPFSKVTSSCYASLNVVLLVYAQYKFSRLIIFILKRPVPIPSFELKFPDLKALTLSIALHYTDLK